MTSGTISGLSWAIPSKSSTQNLLSLAGEDFGRLPTEKTPASQRTMMTFLKTFILFQGFH